MGSRTMTCPCPSLGFERSCSSEWDPMACPLSKADLSGLASPATFAGARYAVLCLLVTVSQSFGNERHYLFECPELHMARAQSSSLFRDAQGSMRSLVWHKDQAAVSQFLAAVLHRIETLNTISSS